MKGKGPLMRLYSKTESQESSEEVMFRGQMKLDNLAKVRKGQKMQQYLGRLWGWSSDSQGENEADTSRARVLGSGIWFPSWCDDGFQAEINLDEVIAGMCTLKDSPYTQQQAGVEGVWIRKVMMGMERCTDLVELGDELDFWSGNEG